jgi:hypothetical protein
VPQQGIPAPSSAPRQLTQVLRHHGVPSRSGRNPGRRWARFDDLGCSGRRRVASRRSAVSPTGWLCAKHTCCCWCEPEAAYWSISFIGRSGLEELLESSCSKARAARLAGRHQSTIYREVPRRDQLRYRLGIA